MIKLTKYIAITSFITALCIHSIKAEVKINDYEINRTDTVNFLESSPLNYALEEPWNMLVHAFEAMRHDILKAAILEQHPNLYHNQHALHTVHDALNKYADYYMISHHHSEDPYSNCAKLLNTTEIKSYFDTHYTPETMVQFLQEQFASSSEKYNGQTISQLCAEYAVEKKLTANYRSFFKELCHLESSYDKNTRGCTS